MQNHNTLKHVAPMHESSLSQLNHIMRNLCTMICAHFGENFKTSILSKQIGLNCTMWTASSFLDSKGIVPIKLAIEKDPGAWASSLP